MADAIPYETTPPVAGARRHHRAELVRAATEIVRTEGFNAASVKAITARAGMSAGLLYSHASSVDDILIEVFRVCAGAEITAIDAAVTEIAATAPASHNAAAQLSTLIETFADRALRSGLLAWSLLVEPVGQAIEAERQRYRREYADLLAQIVTQGIETGEFVEQDPQITAAGLVGAIGEAFSGPLSPISPTPLVGDIDRRERGLTAKSALCALCLRAVGATSAPCTNSAATAAPRSNSASTPQDLP